MRVLKYFVIGSLWILSLQANAANLPAVDGVVINGDQLIWEAQEGASGYNLYLNGSYYDTVRDALSYTLSEPGSYRVISFNTAGEYGVARNEGESVIRAVYSVTSDTVSYDYKGYTLLVYNTCQNVGPGETCIAFCPSSYEYQYGTARINYISGGACSTSDIIEADAFISEDSYRCTVPTFSGEVVAQAICVVDQR